MGSVGNNSIAQMTGTEVADYISQNNLTAQVTSMAPVGSSYELVDRVARDTVEQDMRQREERTEAAKAALKQISGAKRFNEVRFERPDDGHKLLVTVEKVTTRDYWGRSVGRQTYTVYVWDETSKNEYGNSNRLWYNYGVEGMKDVKDQIRRVAHI